MATSTELKDNSPAHPHTIRISHQKSTQGSMRIGISNATPPPPNLTTHSFFKSCLLLNVSRRISGYAILLVSHKVPVWFLHALECVMAHA